MRIPLHAILETVANPRQIVVPKAADDALEASMRAIGLVEPVLVRTADGQDGRYELLAGRRRLAAARRIGWDDIPAHVLDRAICDPSDIALGAAENMVRAPMHPVDQWRAIKALSESHGWTLDHAAMALGVTDGMAKRMRYLAGLAPAVLDALGTGDLPSLDILRKIAQAPHAVQTQALTSGSYAARISWDRVAQGCARTRIPRAWAIFDPALIVWQEDWLAPDDDETRFTTDDVATFMQHQKAALAAQVEASKGRLDMLEDGGPDRRLDLPKGWMRSFGEVPKRWRKDDPRKAFAIVQESGYQLGKVLYLLVEPDPQADLVATTAAKKSRPPVNKVTQSRLAVMKADAVRERLADYQSSGPRDMLKVLLLAFACRNVHRIPWDVESALIDRAGQPRDIDTEDLCQLAAHVIGKVVVFESPDAVHNSGPAAEWIATMIGAAMPRTDTIAVLKGLSTERLIAIATENGIATHGTSTELRKRMAGQLPNWRAADFGAMGPWAGPENGDDRPDPDGEADRPAPLLADADAPDDDDAAEPAPSDHPCVAAEAAA